MALVAVVFIAGQHSMEKDTILAQRWRRIMQVRTYGACIAYVLTDFFYRAMHYA